MGGSGGGGYFGSDSPETISKALRQEEQATESQSFEVEVSKEIGDLLFEYNDRDTEAVRRTLDRVASALSEDLEETSITPIFGGSVRKHTFVNGISDVDALLVLKDSSLSKLSPSEVLDYFENKVKQKFASASIERDRMSVKMTFANVTLQILPAIRKEKTLHI